MKTVTKVQQLLITTDDALQRVDNFLMARYRQVPKSRIYRALRKGEVRVNKKRVKAEYRLQAGDLLRIPPLYVPEKPVPIKPSQRLVDELQQSILYEDAALLVINKPSGVAVHGGSGVKLGIIEALRQIYPNYQQVELAHRLDRDTSGCLMIAKKRSALRNLHEQLRQHQVIKRYQCLCRGRWRGDKQIVALALKKNVQQSGERMVKVDQQQGKASQTTFQVLQRYQQASLMQAELQTGRTHQIRVHAAASKYPIAGDEKYGDHAFNSALREQGLKRLFLHAWQLQFTSPDSKQQVFVEAILPSDLQQVLTSMQ